MTLNVIGDATIHNAPSNRNLQVVQVYDIYNPFLYPWMCLNFFLAFWFLSGMVRRGIYHVHKSNICKIFDALTEDKKRNVITYIFQFWVTLFAFILQIYGGSDILFKLSELTTATRLNCMVLAVFSIAVLYVWELCYREKIGWPLLAHHFVTLLLIQCSTASFYETGNILYVRYAMLLGFHATTEQISFVALFCFRLGIYIRYHAVLFYVAAVQAFVMKTVVTFAAFIFFIRDVFVNNAFNNEPTSWDLFWKILFLPLLVVLYGSQLYACKILYSLGRRCSKSNKVVADVVRRSRLSTDLKELSQALEHGTKETRRHREKSLLVVDGFENSGSIRPSMASNAPTLASNSKALQTLTGMVQWEGKVQGDAAVDGNRKLDESGRSGALNVDESDRAKALRSAILAHIKAEEEITIDRKSVV